MQEFRQQFSLDALMVADSALYSASNLKLVQGLRWIRDLNKYQAQTKPKLVGCQTSFDQLKPFGYPN